MDFLYQESVSRLENDFILDIDLACIYLESESPVKDVLKRVLSSIIKFMDSLSKMTINIFRKTKVKVHLARLKKIVKNDPELGRREFLLGVNFDDDQYKGYVESLMVRSDLVVSNQPELENMLNKYESYMTRLETTEQAKVYKCDINRAIKLLDEYIDEVTYDIDQSKKAILTFYKLDPEDDYTGQLVLKISHMIQKITNKRTKMLANDLANLMEVVYKSENKRSFITTFDGMKIKFHIKNSKENYGAYTTVKYQRRDMIDITLTTEDLKLPDDELTTIIAHEIGHNMSDKGYMKFHFDTKKELDNLKRAIRIVKKKKLSNYGANDSDTVLYIMKEADADIYALRVFSGATFNGLDKYIEDHMSRFYQKEMNGRSELMKHYKTGTL